MAFHFIFPGHIDLGICSESIKNDAKITPCVIWHLSIVWWWEQGMPWLKEVRDRTTHGSDILLARNKNF